MDNRTMGDKMKTIRVVAAIIIDNGRVFATQRGYGEFKDGWEFPGGKIDVGETPEMSLFFCHTCNHRYLMALRFFPNSTNDKHLHMYISDKELNLYFDISY